MMLHGKARPARGSSVPTSGQGLNPIFSTVPNRTKTPQKWFQGFLAFRGVQNVLDLKTVFIVLEMKFAMNFIPKAINTIFSSSHRGSLAKKSAARTENNIYSFGNEVAMRESHFPSYN